jgi:hypothetical protein
MRPTSIPLAFAYANIPDLSGRVRFFVKPQTQTL